MIEVCDNFLEEDIFKDFEKRFCGGYMDWYFNPAVVFPWDEDTLDNYQFVNTTYRNGCPQGQNHDYIIPLLEKLGVKVLLRSKFNLQTRTTEIVKRSFHSDLSSLFDDGFPYKTSIFYLNTNDGYTEFESGEIVKSVANRCLRFDGNQMHRGTTCTNSKTRIVLNINYIS